MSDLVNSEYEIRTNLKACALDLCAYLLRIRKEMAAVREERARCEARLQSLLQLEAELLGTLTEAEQAEDSGVSNSF
jgi:septal ring factor EnvC (AmiA/AmiB activator)